MAVNVPDFGALAQQQQGLNDDATRRTTWSQRPDQSNAMGNITWNQTPDGRWVNSSTLNGGTQNLFNQTIGGQQNLANQVGAGINSDGLIGWGNTDLTSNLGAMPQVGQYNQQVIDAWQRLQQPDLDRNATAARNRLAAQGITLGSNISNTSEGNINDAYGKARDNAILQGYQQGNTEYTQALQGRQQRYNENLGQSQLSNSERQQQFGERKDAFSAAQSGMTSLTGVRDSLDPNKWASKVPQGAVYQPLNLYGAAGDTLNANIQNENLDLAKRNQNISGASNLLGAAGGVGGASNLLGSAWSGAQNLWGGYYGTGANTYGSTFWNGGQDDLSGFINSNNGWGTIP